MTHPAGPLTAVSLFAGIGGIDRALTRAGIQVVAAVEIDQAAQGVIADHNPDVALLDDVTKVTGDQLIAAGFVPDRGIITAGFPCQDLSVAGRRGGLGEGTRSGLFWHVDRLLAELAPAWVLLENVPGLLSATCPCPGDRTCIDNGRTTRCGDYVKKVWHPEIPHGVTGGACPGGCIPTHGGAMGAVLGSLGHRGYGFAYRVLDAQHFGVPQRRARVFVVGHLGDAAGPARVLLEPESSHGDPQTGDQTWPGVAATLTAGVAGPGISAPGRRQEDDLNLVPVPALVSTLQGGGRRGHRIDAEAAAGGHLILTQALHENQRGELTTNDTAGALGAGGGKPGQGYPCIVTPIDLRNALRADNATGVGTPGTGIGRAGDPASTVTGALNGIATSTAVRRLTPLECERLQGLPDGWTATSNGQPQSDSARYRQVGNSVAVPVVEWIARRITTVDGAA